MTNVSDAAHIEVLQAAIAKILPIGNDQAPGDRVIPIYVRMDELRALHALAKADLPPCFQQRVEPWLLACFGAMIAGDREERNHRFLEESLELVQSCGCTASEAHQLVDYVFGRAVGDPPQEVGGVMVTLAALCLANDLDMHSAAETELARIWTKVEVIRAKQAAKPAHSPLPEHLPAGVPTSTDAGYATAFYAIAQMLGIDQARPVSPATVWHDEMLPRLQGILQNGQFLCDRLDDLDWSQERDDVARDFYGHVEPPLARLKGALTGAAGLTIAGNDRGEVEARRAIAGMAAALGMCRDQFAFYAREHYAAGKTEKGDTNTRFADLCIASLTRHPAPVSAGPMPVPSLNIMAADALRGITDDYMTSEVHHLGYVLIPAARFEQLRAASTGQLASRPTDDEIDPHLPEYIEGEKRCGIQRSDWITGWYVPWSPRNDNQNAEGPWSHWVKLAEEILRLDHEARAAIARATSKEAQGNGGEGL